MNPIDDKKMMDYLNGKLSSKEQQEVEEWMLDHPFEAEAYEGLQQAGGETDVRGTVDQLNKQLRIYLQQKKTKRKSRLSTNNTWTYIAVLLILTLAVLVYFVMHLQMRK